MSVVSALARVTAISIVIAVTTAVAACDGDATVDPDGGPGRDAALVEGGVSRDASAGDASALPDAAPIDAAANLECARGDCDPRAADGCSAPAACVLRDRLPVCASGSGDLGEGASCADETECAPGLACFAEAGGGVCARVCCPGDATACDTDERCSADGTLVTGVVTSWGRCGPSRSCDVLMSECAPREGCYIAYPGGEPGLAECRLAGTAEVGDGCGAPEDCLPGLYCAGIGAPTCVRVCRLDDPRGCPSGEGICMAQAYSPEGTGVCVATAGFAR